jgi:two-component system nitrogen regulation response regulator GlnG
MTTRSSAFSVLVLTHDQDLQAELKHDFKEATVTLAKDVASVSKAAKRPFDFVLMEAKRAAMADLTELQRAVDPVHTVILSAPRDRMRQAAGAIRAMRNANKSAMDGTDRINLEGYIESKLGDFVRGMKNSSGRNLHPILISAVERPLIALVLRETNGNQIQAAHLLGMNRNTLRKKISDLRIPVKRERNSKG